MKPAPLILAASLLCNVALIGNALFRQPASPAKPMCASASTPTTPDPRTVAQLFASDDTHALIQRLRENGLPPDIIRAIAKALLDKQFAARRAALEDPPNPYWRKYSRQPPSKSNPARRDEKLALENEYQAALDDLTAGLPPAERTADDLREFGDLPDAKIAQLKVINKDYDDMRSQLRADMKGVTLPGDQALLALLDKEQRADLAKILTPAELRDYDLRTSPLANQVQAQIQYFKATESEYTALYDAQAVINDQAAGANLTPAELRKLREDVAQFILTPERFEEYKITTAPAYPILYYLVVTESQLPKATIAQVITTQNETNAQADRIRSDTTLAPADRDAQLAALAQDARQQLNAALGEKGMELYQNNPASDWLRRLTSKTTIPNRPIYIPIQ